MVQQFVLLRHGCAYIAAQTRSRINCVARLGWFGAVYSPRSSPVAPAPLPFVPARDFQKKRKPKLSKEEEEAAANRQRELLEATAKSFYEDQGL